jgi:hypothetical protein
MALKKKLSSNNGITAEYWKVVGLNISYTGKKCQLFIIGYIDKNMRDSNTGNVMSKNYMVGGTDFDKYFALSELNIADHNPIIQCYKYIKDNIVEFKDSEDI